MTDAERLAELEAALDNILANGQSKSVRGKSITYADPDKLRARIAELRATIAASSGMPAHTYIRRVRR
jgi:hypothetical protein